MKKKFFLTHLTRYLYTNSIFLWVSNQSRPKLQHMSSNNFLFSDQKLILSFIFFQELLFCETCDTVFCTLCTGGTHKPGPGTVVNSPTHSGGTDSGNNSPTHQNASSSTAGKWIFTWQHLCCEYVLIEIKWTKKTDHRFINYYPSSIISDFDENILVNIFSRSLTTF